MIIETSDATLEAMFKNEKMKKEILYGRNVLLQIAYIIVHHRSPKRVGVFSSQMKFAI